MEDLGDPVAHAAELRAAAGLESRPHPRRRPRRPLGEDADAILDAARTQWDGMVLMHAWSARAWDTVAALRPVWWALRAWVAVQLLDAALGPSEYSTVIPSLGAPLVGPVVLLAAVWVSVELGRGRLRPRLPRRLQAGFRVGLLGLNLFAVAMLAAVLSWFPDAWTSHALPNGEYAAQAVAPAPGGLSMDGRVVRNVFAYDSAGKSLTGVQLYDTKGRPLAVTGDRYQRSYRVDGATVWTYPWFNGSQPLLNVFPLPVRRQDSDTISARAWDSARPPGLPPAPLAVVPPVSLPTAASPSPSATPSPTTTASPSATPSGRPTARPSARRPPRASARASARPSG